ACGSGVSGSTTTTTTIPASTSTGPATPSPGVNSSTITIGNVSTTGGLAGALFLGAQVGVQAYVDYVNSTGGVHGRKLVLLNDDDELSCPMNKSETQALTPKVIAFVGQFSIWDNCGAAVIPATVPDISTSLNPTVTKLPNVWSPQPIQNGWSTGTLVWLKEHYAADIGKVGALVGNISTVESSWEGEDNALKKSGFTVVTKQSYDVGQTNLTPEVLAMKNDGVQIVLLDQADVNAIANFVDDMVTQHWHPAIVFNSGSAYDGNFIKLAGAAASMVTIGLHEAMYLGQDAGTIPAVGTFDHWVNVAKAGFTPDLYALFGWTSAVLLVQALDNAGSDPTRASLIAALQKITSFNADGLLAPDDPAAKSPPDCYLIAKVVNGNWQRVTPSSGFTCAGTYITDPQEP
ncbi:MAG TPA: ABC transporter substrate-binding protein, partial [Acidimicrobiales bacterium]|nr:ABC transporter substrate-binding protein [Acidimicrobiales bacterium]